mmetsp:Transcript_19203/g.55761  ORF Transcript_19203/g.55761 Transcript_19203/m.55761 type:complete len:242 (+) Transcript_19203:218-943(+)
MKTSDAPRRMTAPIAPVGRRAPRGRRRATCDGSRRPPQQPAERRLQVNGVAMARMVMETGAPPDEVSWTKARPKLAATGPAGAGPHSCAAVGRGSGRAVGDGSSTRPWELRTGTGAATSPGAVRRLSGMPRVAAFWRIMAPGDIAIAATGDIVATASRVGADFLIGEAVIFSACVWLLAAAAFPGTERPSSESVTVGKWNRLLSGDFKIASAGVCGDQGVPQLISDSAYGDAIGASASAPI